MLFAQIEDSDDEVPELVEKAGEEKGEEGTGAGDKGSAVVVKQNRAEKKSRKVFPYSEPYLCIPCHYKFCNL